MRGEPMPPQEIRLTIPAMRWLLVAASVLVFIAGVQLFVLTDQTDQYFAWTVAPPLTAAFLGAAYWASGAIELESSLRPIWAQARIAVFTALTFSVLTLVATLLHLDRFHLQASEASARAAAWVWLGVYVLVPVLLAGALVLQLRAPGADPLRGTRLPRLFRSLLALQGAVMLVVGLGLFVAPAATAPWWPWLLTLLTARATGAWLVAMSVAAAQTIWENDWRRIGAGVRSYALLGALELVALDRYSSAVNWQQPGGWIYALGIGSVFLVGTYGAWRAHAASAPAAGK